MSTTETPPVAAPEAGVDTKRPSSTAVRGRRVHAGWYVACLLGLAVVAGSVWGSWYLARQWRLVQIKQLCHAAWRSRQWSKLEPLAKTWIQLDSHAATPWIYLADSAQKRGDYAQAAELLGKLPPEDPKTVPALIEQSTLFFGPLNRPLEGVRACERALELEPRALEPRQRLIFYYAQTLQRVKLLKQIRLAIQYGTDTPEDYVYLLGVNYQVFSNGAEQNHHWLENTPDHEDFLIARALHLIGTGVVGDEVKDDPDAKRVFDFERSELIKEHEAILRGYLERFPHNLELLNYFLWKAMTNGEVEEVSRLLREAPPSAADDSRFWRYKGWLLQSQQRYREAEEAYRKALEIFPFDHPTHHQLAQVLRSLGRESEVEYMDALGTRGYELHRELMALPDARSVSPEQMIRIRDYIADCGDQFTADALTKRLQAPLATQITPPTLSSR